MIEGETKMTFNNIPKNLVDDLCGCLDRIEAAIRTDASEKERARLREMIAAAWNDHTVPLATGLQTGLHGEPLHESGPQPVVNRKVYLHGGHKRVIELFSGKRYLAAPTIAGLVGIKREAVWTYLQQIGMSDEYVLHKKEVKNGTGPDRRGYVKLYRVEKVA